MGSSLIANPQKTYILRRRVGRLCTPPFWTARTAPTFIDAMAKFVPGKPTVYVEHSALASETTWVDLRAIFGTGGSARLVASDWTLIEVANDGDPGRAVRRAELIDGLSPLWMMERVHILRREVKNFVWQEFYRADPEALDVFTGSLATMLSYNLGIHTPLGATAKSWVNQLRNDRSYLQGINNEKRNNVEALRTMKKATAQAKKAHEPQVFRAFLAALLPDVRPDGKLHDKMARETLLSFCYEHREKFYQRCPTMAVEDAIYQVRSRDARREPEEQDAIDYQHSVMALAQCDFLLTRDRELGHLAGEATKLLSGIGVARVCRGVEALADALQNSDARLVQAGDSR
jgi:hypothetical protein